MWRRRRPAGKPLDSGHKHHWRPSWPGPAQPKQALMVTEAATSIVVVVVVITIIIIIIIILAAAAASAEVTLAL